MSLVAPPHSTYQSYPPPTPVVPSSSKKSLPGERGPCPGHSPTDGNTSFPPFPQASPPSVAQPATNSATCFNAVLLLNRAAPTLKPAGSPKLTHPAHHTHKNYLACVFFFKAGSYAKQGFLLPSICSGTKCIQHQKTGCPAKRRRGGEHTHTPHLSLGLGALFF